MENKNSSGGIGIAGVLQIIFIVLKLLGVITWSWVWVLSPLWITLIISFVVFIIIFLYYWIKGEFK